jgi:hypothetical protein
MIISSTRMFLNTYYLPGAVSDVENITEQDNLCPHVILKDRE